MKLINPHKVYAHVTVAKLAEELAEEVYEECATRFNNWYKINPDRRKFVKICAPTLHAEARTILAKLCHEDSGLPESEKQKIFEALLMDASIPGERGVVQKEWWETEPSEA